MVDKAERTAAETLQRVITLDLTLAEINPNHKYRLALAGLKSWWLADLAFVKRDDSVYFMPLMTRDVVMELADRDGSRGSFTVRPNAGFHISLHASDSVNVTFPDDGRVELRHRDEPEPHLGPLFAVVVNSTESLRPASTDEINNPPGKVRVMPLPGVWRDLPIGLTFYRSPLDESWEPPVLADLAQVHLHSSVSGKDVQYHVVVWQNGSYEPPPGEIALFVR